LPHKSELQKTVILEGIYIAHLTPHIEAHPTIRVYIKQLCLPIRIPLADKVKIGIRREIDIVRADFRDWKFIVERELINPSTYRVVQLKYGSFANVFKQQANFHSTMGTINNEVFKQVFVSLKENIRSELPLRIALGTLYQFPSGSLQFSRKDHQPDSGASQDECEESKGDCGLRKESLIVSFAVFFFCIMFSFYLQARGWCYFNNDWKLIGATIVGGGTLLGFVGLGWFLFG
jgi:hypothetical protein